MSAAEDLQAKAEELAKAAADAGKIVEVGFIGFMGCAYAPETPEYQRDELREAFFAGAQHLFSTIMTVMDSEREPTAQDMRRLSLVNEELENFIKEFEAKHLKTAGNA